MKRAMCIQFPAWPLQRLRSGQSKRKKRPLVLYQKARQESYEVVCASTNATEQSVLPGMPLAEARAILEKAQNRPQNSRNGRHRVQFVRYDPEADLAGLRELAVDCERYTPVVGLEDSQTPDSLLLDMTGCGHLFGGERGLAEQVVSDLGRRGLTVRVGIADTVGAAWAVAHFAETEATEDHREPICIIASGEQEQTLRPFPVEALRLFPETVQKLHELDIRRIEQLQALPRSSLPSRFGPEVLQRLDQAFGKVPELIVPERPREPAEAVWSSEYPAGDRRVVEQLLEELTEQVVEQLGDRQEGVRRLQIEFAGADGETAEITTGLARASVSVPHIMEIVRVRLERVRLPEDVTTVRVRATETELMEVRQQGLFATEEHTDREKDLACLVDRLVSRFGEACVLRPVEVPDAQPEFACRFEPVLGPGQDFEQAVRPKPVQNSAPFSLSRPLHLQRHPAPVDVLAVYPDGPPVRFRQGHRKFRIIRHWGPERIETGWWRRRGVRRDYFRVETEDGLWFWLFRRLTDGTWFLHGVFE